VRADTSRGKIRRLRTLTDKDLEPIRVRPGRESRTPYVPPEKPRPQHQRHPVVTFLVASAVLVAVVSIGTWAYYGMTHIVSRNAVVKGTITSLGAQLDGVVTSVDVEVGQQVKAGQIVARFEDRQLQANVQRARSRLNKASRELEVERLAIDQEALHLAGRVSEATARSDAASAQVEAARSQADDAAVKYEMRKTLADGGVISPEDLRNAETTRRTAQAQAATAQADNVAAAAAQQLAIIEADGLAVRRKHIRVLQADVAAFQAELELAEADLKAALILAPADGWVVRRIAEPGSSVVVGQPLVALWIGKDVWVETWIDENELSKVAAGSQARVTVKPYPRRVFKGVVETVGVSTDFELPETAVPQPRNSRIRSTPVVCVRVRLEKADGLFPGLSAIVGIRRKPGT